MELSHLCCVRGRLLDERSTTSPLLYIGQVQYPTVTHRIRSVATGSILDIQGTGCIAHSCLRIQRLVTNAAVTTDVCFDGEDVVGDATFHAEHAVREIRDAKEAARGLGDVAGHREEKMAGPPDSLPGDFLQPLIHACHMLRHVKCREQK